MKLQEMEGYEEDKIKDVNPSTINNILGINTPSFKGLEPTKSQEEIEEGNLIETGYSYKDKMPETFDFAKDQALRRKDIHVNRGSAHDDHEEAKELRSEQAYSFIMGVDLDDSYSIDNKVGKYAGAVGGVAIGGSGGAVVGASVGAYRRAKKNSASGQKWTKGIMGSAIKGGAIGGTVGAVAGGIAGSTAGAKLGDVVNKVRTQNPGAVENPRGRRDAFGKLFSDDDYSDDNYASYKLFRKDGKKHFQYIPNKLDHQINKVSSRVTKDPEKAAKLTVGASGAVVGGAIGGTVGAAAKLSSNVLRKIRSNKAEGKKWNEGISKDALKGVGKYAAIGAAGGSVVGAAAGVGKYKYYDKKWENDNFSDDEYAEGNNTVDWIKRQRYAASNVAGALGGSRKYANRVDRQRKTSAFIGDAAKMASEQTGIDANLLNAAGHLGVEAGSYGLKQAKLGVASLKRKWKNRKKD